MRKRRDKPTYVDPLWRPDFSERLKRATQQDFYHKHARACRAVYRLTVGLPLGPDGIALAIKTQRQGYPRL